MLVQCLLLLLLIHVEESPWRRSTVSKNHHDFETDSDSETVAATLKTSQGRTAFERYRTLTDVFCDQNHWPAARPLLC
jgi:hypothetical protein